MSHEWDYREDGGKEVYVPPTLGWADPNAAETATLQVLLGEGQIEGLVDGLKSIYLDGTPIQNSNGSFNFKGIALALVSGTNTQAAVKGVSGIESETSVNVQVVKASPVTRSITSNPSAVRVRIAIPSLKRILSDGSSIGKSVTIKIERQNAAWNGGAWENMPLENGGMIIGGPFSTKYTKGYRIDLPITGTWQIRVTRVSNDDADAFNQSQTWWEATTEIIDTRLRYPNSAVLSMRVNAKQFQNIPRVTCDLKLVRIQVPTNYDPTTRAYATSGAGTTGGAWDGTFKTAWSDNPAWVFYDAASHLRYGAGTFLAASALDKWMLYTIAQWCDALVDDGKGGTEPRMTCNLYMQNQQNAIKALGQLASVFWGVLFYASGLVTPIADWDASPEAIFNSSNVIEGKFTYEGTARTARHTAATVGFINPDLGWDTDTACYQDEAGIARYGYNPLDMTGIGCTSPGQAYRLARWAILTELMAPETCSFASGLEGSTVKPGSVVQIHDQFRAGNVRHGGRVATGATTTSIPLDGPVTIGAGTYTLKIKNASGAIESRTVTTGAGTVSTLAVSPALSAAPAAGTVWLLQSASGASLWRVLAVKKADDGITHNITAILHDPAKYALIGNINGDVVTPDPIDLTAPSPTGLVAVCETQVLNERHAPRLIASWDQDSAGGYVAQASLEYGPWQDMTVSGTTAILDGITPGSWRVRVSGYWRKQHLSVPAETSVYFTAPNTPPTWTATALTPSAVGDGATTQFIYTGPTVTCEDWRGVWTLSAAPRTNLCKQSGAMNATPWTVYNMTGAAITGPDNISVTGKWTEGSGSITPRLYQAFGLINGSTYSLSAYIKAGSRSWVYLNIIDGADHRTWFNVSTGAVGNNAAGNTASIVALGDGWYRISITRAVASSSVQINIGIANADNGVTYTGDGASYIYAWGAQVEAGSVATPYIPTTTAAVTQTDITTSNGLATLSPAPLQGAILRGVSSNASQQASLAAPAIVTDHTAITLPSATYPAGRIVYQTAGTPAGTFWQVNAAGTGWQTPNVGVAQIIGQLIAGQIAAGAITAAKLETDLAVAGVVRSPGYTAGSTGNAPLGFKLSGPAFTTTFADGTTDATCHFEMEGSANFGGKKVATVNARVFQAFNRLVNGKFAYSAFPWAVSGTYATWDSTSKTAGTGSLKNSILGATDETATFTQSFSMPVAPGTVTLQLTTGFSVTVNSGSGTATSEVNAYILDMSTGTETLIGTWTYSVGSTTALAWTDRSVDISSLVSAGGDFALRLTNRVTRTGLSATVNGYIDEVSIIA